ncbi:MAG: hypothetical protein JRH17_09635 [Deltaproteobacteria bacterium]|nr:hypothetical protein [Deltaproteobacteria bacterium]
MPIQPAPTAVAEIATRLRIGVALLGGLWLAAQAGAEPPAAIAPDAIAAETVVPPSTAPSLARLDRPITSPRPAGLTTPRLGQMWRRGIQLERQQRFLEAAAHYEAMTQAAPRVPYAYWKVARNYWRFAEGLPPDAKADRLPWFEKADEWATRGIAVDPKCAECLLWKFGAMGRIGTTRGLVRSVRMAPEMEDLLERGIALQPTYEDDITNSTLGNLYYAGGVFYRLVPDWIWLDWLIGVRGDIDKSLEMIRHATQLNENRIDYQVELGAILYCYAARKDADWARDEARKVLLSTPSLPRRFATDEKDIEHAHKLMAKPELACGFSRDGWIDIDAERRRAGR